MPKRFFPATTMPNSEWWRTLWPNPSCVLRKLCFKPKMSAVDLCCGDGHFTHAMADMLKDRVYGLDIDPYMLEAARSRNLKNVQWIEADARSLAQKIPEPVDVVYMANTFHGVLEPTEMARIVGEVLKPGGMFIVVNWHVAHPEETKVLGRARGPRQSLRMSPVETAQKVEPAGLGLIRVVELGPYHYGAIFQKP